eukprot:CAMPEP_0197627394 /NCGR_PEP_ID=MMETSP1338-20131121/6023_1 /TAXON_ID=43686 ORGANISM="Pelagodinium beii, Strain RCC1491" /NCGR_SAMPLE_ID=MMETSP1338 /ASSEMBLY_ACC=CAM_ASM_000754 /LENGTH=46 /DNA_ID= /DNA_START= /DNA_END= /DNA_ORIENTATION=
MRPPFEEGMQPKFYRVTLRSSPWYLQPRIGGRGPQDWGWANTLSVA